MNNSMPSPKDLGITVPEEFFDATAGEAYDTALMASEEKLDFDVHGSPEWSITYPELGVSLGLYAQTEARANENGTDVHTVLKMNGGAIQFCHKDCYDEEAGYYVKKGHCYYEFKHSLRRKALAEAIVKLAGQIKAHPDWWA